MTDRPPATQALTHSPASFWTLFFLCAYSANSLLEDFAFHCIPAATGISFMLIIVRVGLGFSWAQHSLPLAHMGGVGSGGSHAHVPRTVDGPLRMIALNVTRTVDVERETDFALAPADRGALAKRERERERDRECDDSYSDSAKDVRAEV